jgi:hypothetical protein
MAGQILPTFIANKLTLRARETTSVAHEEDLRKPWNVSPTENEIAPP